MTKLINPRILSKCPTVFTSADDLVPVLSPFGEILSLDLFPSANSPEANAGLVHFRNSEHADQAADALDRQLFSNREVCLTSLPFDSLSKTSN
jgi:hypothetical protein